MPLYYLRATDVTAALDFLEKTPPAEIPGKLRTSRVFLSGHSFGGYTSWIVGGARWNAARPAAACADGTFSARCTPEDLAVFAKDLHDARVVAFSPMAGADFDWLGDYDAAKKPVLVMSGTEDVSAQPAWDGAKSLDLTWIELKGACHQTFAVGGCADLPDATGYQIINTWALAFARKHLLADSGAEVADILSGKTQVDPRVTSRHEGSVTEAAGF